jgi:hypothetical protein
MSIRSWAEITGGFIMLALCGMVWAYSSLFGSLATQLQETVEELGGVRRANVELERDRAAAAVRETTVRTEREAIISAPVTDDAPASSVLLQGLRGADKIGGVQ